MLSCENFEDSHVWSKKIYSRRMLKKAAFSLARPESGRTASSPRAAAVSNTGVCVTEQYDRHVTHSIPGFHHLSPKSELQTSAQASRWCPSLAPCRHL